MGYAAARGGLEAIVAAEDLVRRKRTEGPSAPLQVDQITDRLRLAVDRVMGEAGLWAPDLAARALRQAEGDMVEAAHLLRAYRSTRRRLARPVTVHADELEILRRIVPAYRVPPGPQLLGRTLDYVGRLLDTSDPDRSDPTGSDPTELSPSEPTNGTGLVDRRPGRLLDLLRRSDLAVDRRQSGDPEPYDISVHPVRPGVPRSARLSVMARAETGALVNLWYRNVLGPDGYVHEITLGEVRHGYLPVRVEHPCTGQPVRVGRIRVTETEAIEDLNGADEDRGHFDVGYGMCVGHNERKAIAMANLDIALERDRGQSPLEQSVLMTTDGLESSGFLEHLKLPHYVTFRSMIDRKLSVRSAGTADEKATASPPPPPSTTDGTEERDPTGRPLEVVAGR
jgi:alpha-D-ribose 1-methylphosphonate 5-triphosphate synthase subunit PhnI